MMKQLTRASLVILLVLGTSSLLSLDAYGRTELAELAISGLRTALESLETVEVQFCQVSSASDVGLFPLDYLKNATYGEVVAEGAAPRDDDNPLGLSPVVRSIYRQGGTRQFLEVNCELPAHEDTRTLALGLEDTASKYHEIERNRKAVDHLYVRQRSQFFHYRRVFPDPSILFSHSWIGSSPNASAVFEYVDMVDRQGVTAFEQGDRVVLQANFAFADPATAEIVDCAADEAQAMLCRMELDAESFLPRLIEYGPVDGDSLWQLEIDSYLQGNGAAYPERGTFTLSQDGKLRSIIYFIADAQSSHLNVPLDEGLLTVIGKAGTVVSDEIIGTSYTLE